MFVAVSYLMIASSAFAVLIGVGMFVATVRFLRVAEPATGVVVAHEIKVDESPDQDGMRRSFVYPVVEFADRSGRHHRVTLSTGTSGWQPYPVGTRVEILCPPSAPERARIRGFFHLWSFPVMFTLIGLLGVGCSLVFKAFARAENGFPF